MTGLRDWVERSREQERRTPERYLSSYPQLVVDDETVLMSQGDLDRIERACGHYEGTLPTGVYLGKMWLRFDHLCWWGIDKRDPHKNAVAKSRRIEIVG